MQPHTPRGIRPYYIGLGIIGIFTIVVFFIVIGLGVSGKQDVVTAQKANDIAAKLNNYTDANSKVPSSLSDVGVKDVPSTISYTKLTSTSYKFCATYKSKDTTSPTNSVENGFSEFTSGGATSSTSGLDGETGLSDGSTSFLDVSTYHKGQNCQTISLDDGSGLFDSGDGTSTDGSGSSGTSGSTDPCVYPTDDNSDAAYQKYIDCENNYSNSLNNSDNSGSTDTTTIPSIPTTKT